MLTIIVIIAMVTFITAFGKAVESNVNDERLIFQDTPSGDIDLFEN